MSDCNCTLPNLTLTYMIHAFLLMSEIDDDLIYLRMLLRVRMSFP